eukprot:TRINITY_DN7750_c0_g1_i3.p1 TRINITY_DN7750_c0_g1~~TRINITY_DN7750_c0_g1_i3.p1  ORF type:complete len:271 (+),score=97.01 TRINITY_DN7750_c0_g1_i3:106-813(+)
MCIRDSYGVVNRVILPPTKALAIVEFDDANYASNAFKNLNMYSYKREPLFLEWAPLDFIQSKKKKNNPLGNARRNEPSSDGDEHNEEETMDEKKAKTVFIKNLNFKTEEDDIKSFLDKNGLHDHRSVKIVKKKGQSCGYGFVEFISPESAQKMIKTLQNAILSDHALKLSMSKMEKTDTKKKKRKAVKATIEPSTKVVVRNIAFEATKHDIQEIFKNFGELKSVRLPKKMDGQHR